MIKICAWCGVLLEYLSQDKPGVFDYGICKSCGVKLINGEFEDIDFTQPHKVYDLDC